MPTSCCCSSTSATKKWRFVARPGEAYVGGPIALIQEGDSVTIDAHKLLLQLNISDEEMAVRRQAWVQPKPRYTRGVLAKFGKLASTASRGAVTDAFED
ncbi:hypothetical protein BMR85_025700 [Achromobacter sp. KAs 3-5]|nr:hypothetical protein BMR85_025700 [Achromobacter sp. KAs 3-5]